MPLTLTLESDTAFTLESPQYCTTLERKHMDEHGDDVIRPPPPQFFFGGGGATGGKLVSTLTH